MNKLNWQFKTSTPLLPEVGHVILITSVIGLVEQYITVGRGVFVLEACLTSRNN